MRELHTSDGFTTQVDDCDYDYLMQWLWQVSTSGYVHRTNMDKYGNQFRFHMHIEVAKRMGISVKHQVDHKDRNRLNNQRYNLRSATKSQNQANSPAHKDNIVGYKGVRWHVQYQRFEARICKDGRSICLGYFDSAIKAAEQYDYVARKLFGEFAYLNFPEVS